MEILHSSERMRRLAVFATGTAVAWAGAVAGLANQGVLSRLGAPSFALLVVAGITLPAGLALGTAGGRRLVVRLGLYPLTVLHVWRVPAALLFFWYGAAGMLPPAFWIPAGVGDFFVGIYAARALVAPVDRRFYWRFHVLGAADFVVAVGLGLVYSLLQDPRMDPITMLPLALIPLFGVGISGASHLVAFHLLKQRAVNR